MLRLVMIFYFAISLLIFPTQSLLAADMKALDRDFQYEIQMALKTVGHDPGLVDGRWGKNSEKAFRNFCSENDIEYTDKIEKIWPRLLENALDKKPIPLLASGNIKDISFPTGELIKRLNDKQTVSQCEFALSIHKRTYIPEANYILNTSHRFRNGFSEYIKSFNGDDEAFANHIDPFKGSLNKLSYECILSNYKSCEAIITVMDSFAKSYQLQTEKFPPKFSYMIEARVLMPLMEAYDVASSAIGFPDKHKAYTDWFLTALNKVTYRSFGRKKYGDFWRDSKIECLTNNGASEAANNHNLQSGYLWALYGTLAKDEHAVRLGYDTLALAIGSVDEEGRLLCEVDRGALALAYSGTALHYILKIDDIMARNKVPIPEHYNQKIEAAANFLVNAAFDNKLLGNFPKANRGNWCSNSWKPQCIENQHRTGFAWVTKYILKYPNSEAEQKIFKIYENMSSDRPLEYEYRRVASAFLLGHFPNKDIKKNILRERLKHPQDLSLTYFDSSSPVVSGSAGCIDRYRYGVLKK